MSKTLQTVEVTRDNHRILAYMNHMEKTAQLGKDKRLFKAFAQQAKRRIEASGGLQTNVQTPEIERNITAVQTPAVDRNMTIGTIREAWDAERSHSRPTESRSAQ